MLLPQQAPDCPPRGICGHYNLDRIIQAGGIMERMKNQAGNPYVWLGSLPLPVIAG